MAVVGEVTYLRRFAGKFVEIVAAGIGTAVSGYLVAYIAGHFSLTMPTAAETPAPQATGWSAVAHGKTSIEDTVRAALASHDGSQASPVDVASQQLTTPQTTTLQTMTPQTMTPVVAETPALPTATAPPLAAAEIRSLPVAAVDSPSPDAWPADPYPTGSTGRVSAFGSLRMLPPQPPPVNGNLLAAFKRFF